MNIFRQLPQEMLNRFILLLVIFYISACSSSTDDDKEAMWTPAEYAVEASGKHVDLSIHSLDGVEDILQADIMIHYADGSGASFEVQNASVEQDGETLSFEWVDGFENKGKGTVKKLSGSAKGDKEQKVVLKLEVDDVVNERDMMFVDEYELKQIPLEQSEIKLQQSSSSLEKEQ